MKDEIIICQAEESAVHIQVRVEEETVWLNRLQISSLFDRDVKTIGKHIKTSLKKLNLIKVQLSQILRLFKMKKADMLRDKLNIIILML